MVITKDTRIDEFLSTLGKAIQPEGLSKERNGEYAEGNRDERQI